eukprot:snap_masked-scaffold_47-processed-gene-0.30-mRNA-1 protein AED:1.00 eAED:1.00 QI:0/0/0/0/1/1/2/0/70
MSVEIKSTKESIDSSKAFDFPNRLKVSRGTVSDLYEQSNKLPEISVNLLNQGAMLGINTKSLMIPLINEY